MKKVLMILLAAFVLSFSFAHSGIAQLKRDVRYIRGIVLNIDDEKKSLVVKDAQTLETIVFDIGSARRPDHLAQGQDVIVIAPVNSNVAKSVRFVAKR